jgi:flavin reductase (DIM6/NTAB) family NADH-FMN oxidoreductase RutF
MGKVDLGPQPMVPVRSVFLLGTMVDGKVDFMTIGGGGTVSADPVMIALPIGHPRYSLKGIMENRVFSVNVPTVDLVVEADYCGIVSGRDTDKAKDCDFDVFFGKLKTAPMITQCPINMECTVVHLLGSNTHTIVIGKVEATYISDQYMKDGKPDFDNLNPLLWFRNMASYVGIGKIVGKSSSTGKELKTRKSK